MRRDTLSRPAWRFKVFEVGTHRLIDTSGAYLNRIGAEQAARDHHEVRAGRASATLEQRPAGESRYRQTELFVKPWKIGSKVEAMDRAALLRFIDLYDEMIYHEPCEHGHLGCSTHKGGPCFDEACAHESETLTQEELRR